MYSEETEWARVRSQRDVKLQQTDWLFMPDAPVSPQCKAKFLVYRQKLRDIPQTNTNPRKIKWPTKPEVY